MPEMNLIDTIYDNALHIFQILVSDLSKNMTIVIFMATSKVFSFEDSMEV